ncbi:MAG: DUF3465 domain-containing protein [Candidatus Dormibacteria bacterium]
MRNVTAILVLLAVAACGGPSGNDQVRAAFRDHHSYLEVTASGSVQRTLADLPGASPHQRFIMELDGGGQTLLVDVNLDIAGRVPVSPGESVQVHGEYIWNSQGGLVHWVHRDPSGRHEPGWVQVGGRLYSRAGEAGSDV